MVRIRREKGFALIAALLTAWVLAALGILVFTVSTQDVRISSRFLGEKKAFSAAESGVSSLAQSFNPANLGDAAVTNRVVNTATDQDSRYSISAPTTPTTGPSVLPTAGYGIGGGETWGQTRYTTTVTGENPRYASRVDINVGIGYGPVEITTNYR